MVEVRSVVEWMFRQQLLIQLFLDANARRRLGLPMLGCAAMSLLMVGCSTVPTKDGAGSELASNHSSLQSSPVPQGYCPTGPGTCPPKWQLDIPDEPSIDLWVKRYSVDKRASFEKYLERATRYVAPAQRIFEEKGLPKDLVCVALVESGFVPSAKSHASAVGMWQFISATGKRFGLEQNQWVDERRHPFKSAEAAADYLSFLYDNFQSWPLALAAYNAGENGVRNTLEQSGLKTFWELREAGYLPQETRDYVPKVLAAVKIIRNPDQYGFYFNREEYTPWFETVRVPGGMPLSWLEEQSGISESALRGINPELCKPVTPPNCSSYELCVPQGTGDLIQTALARCSESESKPWEISPEVLREISAPIDREPKRGNERASHASSRRQSNRTNVIRDLREGRDEAAQKPQFAQNQMADKGKTAQSQSSRKDQTPPPVPKGVEKGDPLKLAVLSEKNLASTKAAAAPAPAPEKASALTRASSPSVPGAVASSAIDSRIVNNYNPKNNSALPKTVIVPAKGVAGGAGVTSSSAKTIASGKGGAVSPKSASAVVAGVSGDAGAKAKAAPPGKSAPAGMSVKTAAVPSVGSTKTGGSVTNVSPKQSAAPEKTRASAEPEKAPKATAAKDMKIAKNEKASPAPSRSKKD